ncbi:MAG: hypothetical protein EXR48_01840 [Dehalococcoidia bacterium]|nr:hypothetical protein [Dehalococcoidia bacterium]
MYSLLVRGGKVLDGTGNPWCAADLAVEGDTLRILPAGSQAQAQQVIDAGGLVVAPGFIDLHTHAGLLPFMASGMEAFIRQGITTVLVGLDGYSSAPFPTPERFAQAMELMAGLEGRLPEGAGWQSVDAYLKSVDGHSSCNVATLVGNGTLRLASLGWGDRRPEVAEGEAMARLLAEGLEQGAFGLSSGLVSPPSSFAQTEELVQLCQVMKPFGGLYVTHLRSAPADQPLTPLQEAVETAKRAGVRVHISHLSTPKPGGARELLEAVERARCEGTDLTFDAQPYPYSVTPLAGLLPAWAIAGGPHALRKCLRDRKERLRIARDPAWLRRDFRAFLVTNLSRKRYAPYDGWPLESIAQATGESVVDTVCGLLLEEQLAPSCVGLGGNAVNIRSFCTHEAHLVSSGGAPVGARCNPRTFGAFPRVLGELCREEGLLRLPDAVRRMTSMPAAKLGLKDRGRLLDGMKADLVLFDPNRVGSRASLEDPARPPDGIAWVVVNGVCVVTPDGQAAATPGRALRRR